MKRSYLYNKANKEGLYFVATRFEVKLRDRYFLWYGLDFNSISNALNKYAVFYFSSSQDKEFEANNPGNKKP